MRRATLFCKHFRSMFQHKTCSAGVAYESLKAIPWDSRPCFSRAGDTEAKPGCDLVALPTLAEQAEEEAEIRVQFENLGKARKAIVTHLGGPWKRGMPDARGVIDCPVCAGKESLAFRRAGYNGHIHATCATEDCVSWME